MTDFIMRRPILRRMFAVCATLYGERRQILIDAITARFRQRTTRG